jgi:hypothetical protein
LYRCSGIVQDYRRPEVVQEYRYTGVVHGYRGTCFVEEYRRTGILQVNNGYRSSTGAQEYYRGAGKL